jgi:hypothetical protein
MTLCMPNAGWIPGQWFDRAPFWWDKTDEDYLEQLDDPRWIGSAARSYNSGTGAQARFRAVHHVENGQQYLFLALQAFLDPNRDAQADKVFVGLQRMADAGAGVSQGPAYVIEVPGSLQVIDQKFEPTGGPAWNTIPTGGGQLTSVGGATPDIKDRQWLEQSPTSNTSFWAFHLRIPIRSSGADIDAGGLNLGTFTKGFKLWYWIRVAQGKQVGNDFISVSYYLPRTGAEIQPGNTFPGTAKWETARVGTGGGSCGAGISLASSDITANGGTNQIKASLSSTELNTFVVRPKNNQIAAGIADGTVEAQLRIANWGSQTPIDKAPAGTTEFEVIPFGAGDVWWPLKTTPPGGTVPDGAFGQIDATWSIDPGTAALFVGANPPRAKHQCIFAQLRDSQTNPPAGGGYDYLNDSTFNNMEFKKTGSPMRDTAEISVKGRKPTTGGGSSAKVYVFVERSNLPGRIAAGENPEKPPLFTIGDDGRPQYTGDRRVVGTVDMRRDAQVDLTHVDHDVLAAAVPTVRYHVFYPTGVTYKEGGKSYALYEPQTSFGYFVSHSGPAYGWTHELLPASPASGALREGVSAAKPRKLGDDEDHYTIDVPHDGTVALELVLTPLEEPPRPGAGGCLGMLLPFLTWLRKLWK